MNPPYPEMLMVEEPKPEKPKFYTLLLAEAVAKYGSIGESDDNLDGDREGRSTGLFGGQLTLGLLPGGKYFTMAARLSGGAFVSGDRSLGTLGASMLFGANFLRSDDGRNFSYALAGAGVEFMPGANQDMLAFHVAGGTVVRGVSFSAGIDLGGNDDVGFALFGMQIGWGHLF
jgi:hypothetical protein